MGAIIFFLLLSVSFFSEKGVIKKNKYLQLKDPINYKPITHISDFSEDKIMKYKIKYLQLKEQLKNSLI